MYNNVFVSYSETKVIYIMGGLRMKNKAKPVVILSIVAVIGGMVLNFQEFLMGSPANAKNLIVTFTYIAIWILVLIIGMCHGDRYIDTIISILYSFINREMY